MNPMANVFTWFRIPVHVLSGCFQIATEIGYLFDTGMEILIELVGELEGTDLLANVTDSVEELQELLIITRCRHITPCSWRASCAS